MKHTLLLLMFILLAHQMHSQDQQAKAYFFTAVDQYKSGNYHQALSYCQKAEEIIGKTNARIEAVRVKSYYASDDIIKAKASLETFLTLKTDEQLLKDIAPYIAKIEEAEKEEKRRQELAAKKAEEKAEYDRTHTTCSLCMGSGTTNKKVECYTCYGAGKVKGSKKTCQVCRGTGKGAVTYDFFGGKKTAGCNNCHNYGWIREKETCPACHGEGKRTITKTCSKCYGKGDVKKE